MRIINLKEFRKLAPGTVFMKYQPCSFEDLSAKGQTWKHDFLYENITYEFINSGSGDFGEKLQLAEEIGESLPMDFDNTSRDGCFNDDQLFAVYERVDIERLIDKLKRCKKMAYTVLTVPA